MTFDAYPCAEPTGHRQAKQILERAAGVYRTCWTYRDDGLVEQRLTGCNVKPRHLAFQTDFVRPNRIRFLFTDAKHVGSSTVPQIDKPNIIWRDEKLPRFWRTMTRELSVGFDLFDMLGSAAGASRGSSCRVPRLLMPELLGMGPLEVADPLIVSVDQVGRRACFKIQSQEHGRVVTIWIDAGSFLLRKLITETSMPDGTRLETLTSYDPEIDTHIGPEEFAFEPPL